MVACKPLGWVARYFAFLAPLVCAVNAAPPDDHRVVLYYQTGLGTDTTHVPLLPLIQAEPTISATHLLIAAMHIIDDDGGLHLNDHPPDSPIFDTMWSEAAQLQAAGIKIMCMVGGAAQGSFQRLDGDDASFERYYGPLHDLIGAHNLQGLDLDVEETFSLNGVIRLIDRLKADFGNDFIITLAPVAAALSGGGNLSGFSYFDLEAQRGGSIAFYNAQFYYGWGNAGSASDYESIIDDGFAPNRVVMGVLSNPDNGSGYVSLDAFAPVLQELVTENGNFGGVANWEYFNSLPGGKDAPYQWASWMAQHMGTAKRMARREISSSEALWRGVRKMGRGVRREAKKVYHNYIA